MNLKSYAKNLLNSIETNIKHLPYTNKYKEACMYDKMNISVSLVFVLNILYSLE